VALDGHVAVNAHQSFPSFEERPLFGYYPNDYWSVKQPLSFTVANKIDWQLSSRESGVLNIVSTGEVDFQGAYLLRLPGFSTFNGTRWDLQMSSGYSPDSTPQSPFPPQLQSELPSVSLPGLSSNFHVQGVLKTNRGYHREDSNSPLDIICSVRNIPVVGMRLQKYYSDATYQNIVKKAFAELVSAGMSDDRITERNISFDRGFEAVNPGYTSRTTNVYISGKQQLLSLALFGFHIGDSGIPPITQTQSSSIATAMTNAVKSGSHQLTIST
jgi:hypothetical protein